MPRPDLTVLMERLGADAASQVLSLWDLVATGRLPAEDFVETAAARVALANGRGQVLATTDFLEHLAAALGEVPPAYTATPPLQHFTDTDRIGRGLTTITERAMADDYTKSVTAQLVRFARSEVFEATQKQYAAELATSPLVAGWVRGVEASGCELCSWWSREGRVWPATHEMPTHKGCHCRPIPVFRRGVKRVSRAAMNDSGDRRAAGTWKERQAIATETYSRRSVKWRERR